MTLTGPKSLKTLAERKRFELSKGLPLYTLSRGAPSMQKAHEIKAFMRFSVTAGDGSTQYMTGTDAQKWWSRGERREAGQLDHEDVIETGLHSTK